MGLVVDEPSVAAVNMRTGSLIAVGALAEQMTGRTPAYIRVARPVSGGTVVDIDMAQRMLRHLLGEKLRRQLRRKPRLRAAACTPHDADPLAQRATVETLVGLGARRVELVDTLIAAALGCGLPVEQPTATMIMVCGAATTQIAVLSLGSIVTAVRVPIGGEAIDNAVIQHLRQHHQLVLPSQSVRPLQLALRGNGLTLNGPATTEIHGRDVVTGLARSVEVDTAAVRQAIHAPLTAVLDGLGKVLRDCPPDLVADIAESGIMMVGGSALLPGFDQMLREATGVPVNIAERPDVCSVLGLGAMLDGTVQPLSSPRSRAESRSARRWPGRTSTCGPPSSTSWTPPRRSPGRATAHWPSSTGRTAGSPTCSPPVCPTPNDVPWPRSCTDARGFSERWWTMSGPSASTI